LRSFSAVISRRLGDSDRKAEGGGDNSTGGVLTNEYSIENDPMRIAPQIRSSRYELS
jgi:hypothetical protein